MNSKELFGLFLRIVGVLGIIFIIHHVLPPSSQWCASTYLIVKWAIGLLVGLYLVRGAPLLVKFAFPAKHLICEP